MAFQEKLGGNVQDTNNVFAKDTTFPDFPAVGIELCYCIWSNYVTASIQSLLKEKS